MRKDEIRKILIHYPNDIEYILASFPALYAIKNNFPEAEIYIITYKEYVEFFQILPFRVRVYSITDENYKNPLSIHHYAFNLFEVFNIDLSFSLDENWKSAFLAFCLRSRHRLGLKSGPSKLLLENALQVNPGQHPADIFVRLLNKFVNEERSIPSVVPAKFVPYLHDWDIRQYIVIAINPFQLFNENFLNSLREIFLVTKHVTYVFVIRGEISSIVEDGEDLPDHEKLIETFEPENNYKFAFEVKTLFEYIRLFKSVRGVITSFQDLSYVSNYLEVPFFQIGAFKYPLKKTETEYTVSSIKSDGSFENAQILDELHRMCSIQS